MQVGSGVIRADKTHSVIMLFKAYRKTVNIEAVRSLIFRTAEIFGGYREGTEAVGRKTRKAHHRKLVGAGEQAAVGSEQGSDVIDLVGLDRDLRSRIINADEAEHIVAAVSENVIGKPQFAAARRKVFRERLLRKRGGNDVAVAAGTVARNDVFDGECVSGKLFSCRCRI